MKRKTIIGAVLALGVVGMGFAFWMMWRPAIPPVSEPRQAGREAQERGRRIAEAGDCAVCHTRPGGAYMAGGLPLKTPFGTLFTTNITPDRETGIGRWSPEAFQRAMREGVARDGHFLYPAFPYVHYRKMTDADIADTYAFLMSVDPVNYTAPENHMIFPMNFRPLVSFWNLLFLHGDPLEALPNHSAQWNRGRYLVEGPGHCSSCHSPLNLIGGEKSGELFNGAVVDGWTAPGLRGMATAEHPWNETQLVAYLTGEVAEGHGAAAGPMLPVSLSIAQLPKEDAQAIAHYILDLKKTSSGEALPPCTAAARPSAQALLGASLFDGACASCHGPAAPMRVLESRPALAQTSAVMADSPRNLIQTLLQGIPMSSAAPSHYMPAFAHSLDDTHLAAIAVYLRDQSCATRPWTDLDPTIKSIRAEEQQP
ncbi:c-type cytochrome [Pseudomonas sp. 14P_8.1_Bac3]|uniref:c-type cytochrome n=1 Tax=Pseudomonas sp. 14P_8.1_Bac3 TaxID=2971621 RepID=UPI0021C677E7|nr:c-type cytochrome [Pseudomonas sp. 14P_8.1_Bac3]MCU1760940.1 c-type cytochrome [Pseudomonas sp. 14P_8.1_Bac3]